LAGVGTGKTETLMTRYANIVDHSKEKEVMCITFTKKAAEQMKQRASHLL